MIRTVTWEMIDSVGWKDYTWDGCDWGLNRMTMISDWKSNTHKLVPLYHWETEEDDDRLHIPRKRSNPTYWSSKSNIIFIY